MTEADVAIAISVLALVATGGNAWINFVNMRERRRSEVATLRSSFFRKTVDFEQRIATMLEKLEALQQELRCAKDSDAKYKILDEFPSRISKLKQTRERMESYKGKLAKIDARKASNGALLEILHEGAALNDELEANLTGLEASAPRAFEAMRTRVGLDP